MRFPLLVCSIFVLSFLITSGTSFGIQAAQPAPFCIWYEQSVGNGTMPMQADVRDGQMSNIDRGYPSSFDVSPRSRDYASDGRAFFIHYESPYAGPDTLLIGVPSNDKLQLVKVAYSISAGWSPDGQTLAYIYYDASRYHIATIDHAGNNKRVQVLDALSNYGRVYFIGWSPDGQYFAVMKFDNYDSPSVYQMHTYYFITANSLQLLPNSVSALVDIDSLNGLVWSPQGHYFAYIDTDLQLVIATPESGIETRFEWRGDEMGHIRLPLLWSPNGRYVAISGYTFDKERFQEGKGTLWEYWAHTIFGIDRSIKVGIQGRKLYPLEYGIPDSQWAADGSVWLFRQHLLARNPTTITVEETDENLLSYLVAYDVENDSMRIVAYHVAGSPLLLDGSDWLAIPVWSEGKINIELHEAATLRYTIDHNFDEIIDTMWLAERHAFAYIARIGTSFTFGIVDLDAGTSLIRLEGFPSQSFLQPPEWPPIQRIILSPSGRTLLLTVGARERQSIIIISMETKDVQPIRIEGYKLSDIYWSPDERSFVFLQYDEGRKLNVLNIVSAEGDTIREVDLLNENNRLVGWTWCK